MSESDKGVQKTSFLSYFIFESLTTIYLIDKTSSISFI
ncbi:hypothetical protein SAMN05444362_10672 [Dysgonomonas macrotermitis]|uniref:Uncharacterized protein n=1 Tax=Dysgonomonas macrotermitis TaxID=1346286 RepID=A0A1M5BHK1_9BACT|nr:hypothetical protein SAMN05444362_10672 [Dysgonomonas macrotermitis]